MKKTIALISLLVLGALSIACGGPEAPQNSHSRWTITCDTSDKFSVSNAENVTLTDGGIIFYIDGKQYKMTSVPCTAKQN